MFCPGAALGLRPLLPFRYGHFAIFFARMEPTMRVRFRDILQAFQFGELSGDMVECRTFVCRQTGKIDYQFGRTSRWSTDLALS